MQLHKECSVRIDISPNIERIIITQLQTALLKHFIIKYEEQHYFMKQKFEVNYLFKIIATRHHGVLKPCSSPADFVAHLWLDGR